MATKDVVQTHKDFKKRIKRLKIKNYYDEKENIKLNEIGDIDNEIEKLQAEKEKKVKEYNEISSEKLEKLSIIYNDPALLSEIVKLAKHTTFSHSSLKDIEEISHTGINSDDIDMDLIEKITLAEESVNREIPHTNCISDVLNDFGGKITLPNEKGGG